MFQWFFFQWKNLFFFFNKKCTWRKEKKISNLFKHESITLIIIAINNEQAYVQVKNVKKRS